MRRLGRVCVVASIVAAFAPTPALAGGDSAGVADDVVWVSPETSGLTTDGDGPNGADGDSASPCDYTVAPADPVHPWDGQGEKVIDGVVHYLFYRDCLDGLLIGPVWVPPPTPAQLLPAVKALVEERLHYPTPTLRPVDEDFGWTYVQVPIDFRIAPNEWADVEAYAEVSNPVGRAWVRAIATPIQLVFNPGDGSELVRCTGVEPVAAYEPERPGGCSLTYSNASSTARNGRTFVASAAIVWEVTWVSSDPNQSGQLDVSPTETTIDVAVAEAKALVTCTGSRTNQGGC